MKDETKEHICRLSYWIFVLACIGFIVYMYAPSLFSFIAGKN